MTQKPQPTSPSAPGSRLHLALLECTRKVQYIIKETQKVSGQYYPVSYNTVVRECKPVLLEHGLNIFFSTIKSFERPRFKPNANGQMWHDGYFASVTLLVTVIDSHDPEASHSFRVCGSAWDTLDKAMAKAQTTARKMAYLTLFQLESYEEGKVPEEEPKAPVPSAAYTPISADQVKLLLDLAAKVKVTPEIVAKAADANFTRLEEIPVEKFEVIRARLQKRADQLAATPPSEAQ